jgi:pimeloyl-ACP methyl ester carboxylesterase
VPLDYEDEAAGTTDIAFLKWAAGANSTAGTQDIIINPGGPGGSGVSWVIDQLEILQETLGTQHNIVGMDPRGVNNSGPSVSCLPGREDTSRYYPVDMYAATDAEDSKVLAETWAKAGAIGEWCSKVHSDDGSAVNYVNTVATATDMLHYTKVLAKSKNEDPEKSQLWYYGVSYGSVLGSTFASLFPDRIGRLIIDGVVDVENYYQGKWSTNLLDADEAAEYFFTTCYDAGSSRCGMWADSPEAIKERYNKIVENLKEHPLIAVNTDVQDYPYIITYADLQQLLLSVPYAPVTYHPILDAVLVGIESGDASLAAQVLGTGVIPDTCTPIDSDYEDYESRLFIACNDANGRNLLNDYDDWLSYVSLLKNQSSYLGEVWAGINPTVSCRKLSTRPPASQAFPGKPQASNTSNPLLIVSNTIDPVTPLWAARQVAEGFPGSGLLVQDAVGHASISAASKCTRGHFDRYLADATLPPEGTVCEVDETPFVTATDGTMGIASQTKVTWNKKHFLWL